MKAAAATEDLMAVQQLASLTLSDEEHAELKSLTLRRKTAQALALRARIVLTCAEGGQNKEVAARLGLDRSTVGKWRRRFVERRVDGLHDEPRSGAPRTIDDARIEAVIVRTLESCPENATHWSSRDMGEGERPVALRSSTDTTPTQNRSDGPSPPMTSLLPSNASADTMPRQNTTRCRELLVQNTRAYYALAKFPRLRGDPIARRRLLAIRSVLVAS
jgi:hypothetical protein